MPASLEAYRDQLRQLPAWDDYLRQESRLPGPRANLELLEAVIAEGDAPRFAHLLALEASFPQGAPPNTPDEFLTVCAVAGLGKIVAAGEYASLRDLRRFAGDERWRVREAVAIALQHWGDADLPALLVEMADWGGGSWLERRAAVAALAEPRLLRLNPQRDAGAEPAPAHAVLPIFDAITQAVVAAPAAERRQPAYGVLRQALGYGWSVLVAADPTACLPAFASWLDVAETTGDKDLRWIARQNLRKHRLQTLDGAWAAGWLARLG